MPRLREIRTRDELQPGEREIFDRVEASRGGMRLPYSVFLNHPGLAEKKLEVGSFVRFETSLPKRVSEVAICLTARDMDCEFIWAAHSVAAKREGVPETTLRAMADRTQPVFNDAAEELAARIVTQLLQNHRVSDADFSQALGVWGERGVIELIATIGYYAMSACWMNALEILPPSSDASQVFTNRS